MRAGSLTVKFAVISARFAVMEVNIQVSAEEDDVHTPIHPHEADDDSGKPPVDRIPAAVVYKQREQPREQKPADSGGDRTREQRTEAELHSRHPAVYERENTAEDQNDEYESEFNEKCDDGGDEGHALFDISHELLSENEHRKN